MFSLKTLVTHTYTQKVARQFLEGKRNMRGFIRVGQLAYSVMHERETGANISHEDRQKLHC